MNSPLPPAELPVRLLLLHGLASSPKEFGMLKAPLRRRGIQLVAPEVPGYSGISLASKPRAEDWVASAAQVVREIAASDSRPMVLGGLCTGSLLAAAVAGTGSLSAKVLGLALLSPSVACDGWGLPWWYSLRHGAYALGMTNLFSMVERAPYGIKNERIRSLVRRQLEGESMSRVGPGRVPLRNVRESERLASCFLENVLSVDLPMLVQHAREDEVCSIRSVRKTFGSVPSNRYTMRVLDDSYHMITVDGERQVVADGLADFAHELATRQGARETAPRPVQEPSRASAWFPVLSPIPA